MLCSLNVCDLTCVFRKLFLSIILVWPDHYFSTGMLLLSKCPLHAYTESSIADAPVQGVLPSM